MFPFLVALASDGTFLGILVFSFLAGYCVSALRTWKMEESGEVGGSTLWGHMCMQSGEQTQPSLLGLHI